MDLSTVLLTLMTGGLVFYYFVYRRMRHFAELGVVHEPPLPILGNMAGSIFHRVCLVEHLQALYNRYSDFKYFGFYECMQPVIVIRDPELVTSIAVKNFDNFTDHRTFGDEKLDPLMNSNLFSMKGDSWRETRKILSPTFTSSKMKLMFKLIGECAENFAVYMTRESKGGKVMNVKDIIGRYANDVVATCAFGISVDSFKNLKNDFYLIAKKAMDDFNTSISFKFFVIRNFTTLTRFFGIRMMDVRTTDFFYDLVRNAVNIRKKQGHVRPDMIQLMMDSEEKGAELTIEEMTAHAFIFFLAGFDSTSTFASFVLHEIAVNPEVHARLKSEVEEVVQETNGKPNYDAIMNEMKYLDAVVNETLRLYPLAAFQDRLCVKEFTLPPATAGAKPVTVKPGDPVWYLPVAIHRDPQYFPDPNKFDPERFLSGSIPQSIYFPFGLGPRSCIGNRFALMELKVLVFYLLWHCDIEPCSKTTHPMVFSKKSSLIMMPKDGFWLRFRTREDGDPKLSAANA